MDAADRAELESLRRRAYGPDADVFEDAPALARLIELEDLARAGGSGAAPAGTRAAMVNAAAGETAAQDDGNPAGAQPAMMIGATLTRADSPAPILASAEQHARTAVDPGSSQRRRPRRSTLVAAAAAVVAIAIAIALTTAHAHQSPDAAATTSAAKPGFVFGGDPDAQTLLILSLAGPTGFHVDWPADGQGRPAFPEATPIRWASDIGTYYGWHLWVAGGDEGTDTEYCILIERAVDVRSRCVSAADRARGRLSVSISAPDIDPDQRPGMSISDAIGFWWLEQNRVEAVLGTFAPQ